MTSYLFLSFITIATAMQTILAKKYNTSNSGYKGSISYYNLIFIIFCILVYTVASLIDFSFNMTTFMLALAYGLCFFLVQIGLVKALQYGLSSMTSMLIQLSLILTAVYGLIVWKEPFTLLILIGLILIVIAIVLCVVQKQQKTDIEKLSNRKKWLFWVFIAFFCNIACSILQKTHQLEFDGEYRNLFMLTGMCLCFVLFLTIFILDNKSILKTFKKITTLYPVIAGITNGVANIFIMILALLLSGSIVYPVMSIGSLVIVLIFSIFIFKEKLSVIQWIGVVLGCVATVLLVI